MKTLLATLLLISVTIAGSCAMAKAELKSYTYIAKADNTVSSSDSEDLYLNDLNRVEMHLYHKIYPKQSLNNRMGRIEKTLFRKSYSNLSYTERMNNILSCYQDYYNMKTYVSNYYSPNLLNRMYRRYHGYPTGLTPAISPSILNSRYLNNGYNSFYRTNRGYRYRNAISPMMGAGVRILD